MLSNQEKSLFEAQFASVFRQPTKYIIYTQDPAGKKTVLATVSTYPEVKKFLTEHANKYPTHNSPIVSHHFE